jgi:acetyl esterase
MSTVAPVLEEAAQKFADATAQPPFLYDLGPLEGRRAMDEIQGGRVPVPDADVADLSIPGGPSGTVSIRVFRPVGVQGPLPVVMYLHGAGWVFGNAHTHDRLVRELTVRARAATVFVNYSLAPETKYPTALEETYAALLWISAQGASHGLDPDRVAVAGDSAGGNLAAATTLLAKQRKGPRLAAQLLFCPVTDASFDTDSYQQFASGYFLSREGMKWFWDQYTTHPAERTHITASPLRASLDELHGLPPALVILAEADVLRDEGEAYAAKLRAAGVRTTAVRYQGVIHGFVMLNAMKDTRAARAATQQGGEFLHDALHPDCPI